MDRAGPDPVDTTRARKPRRSGIGLFSAVLALSLAFFSVLLTALLLDRPEAQTKIAALLGSPGIRTLSAPAEAPGLELARVRAERDSLKQTLAQRTAPDATVTGTLPASGQALPAVAPPPAAPPSGIDLGPGRTLAELKQRWVVIGTARPLLPYRAVVAVEDRDGQAMLRLVAGPLVDATEAAALCERLGAIVPQCRPAAFDGQSLSSP